MKIRTNTLLDLKQRGVKIAALTCFDWPSGCFVDASGAEVALVGDSLGMVVLGLDSTLPVTLDDMVRHTQAARRGVRQALLVADLPFLSYQLSAAQAIQSAGRLLQEAGAEAVKLEGGLEMAATLRAMRYAGIAVMGHVGLTPQSVHALGGYRHQGKTPTSARQVLAGAKALEKAGAFAVVLELIPPDLARRITRSLRIPTIGIGAGPHCDGQVLVTHDALGLAPGSVPPHARKFASLYQQAKEAAARYVREVKDGKFPS